MVAVQKRRIGVCIFLSIVTAGIYYVYWKYLLVKNIRAIQNDNSRCTGEMLRLIFIPLYSLYWWFIHGKIVKDSFVAHEQPVFGNENAYLILGVFGLEIISMAIMQKDFNSLPTGQPRQRIYNTRDMVIWALLSALAYAIVAFVRIPVFPAAPYLHLEFKDAVLAIGAFIYGPVAGAITVTVVSLVELVTISSTGWIGAVMNILSSCAFVCVAAGIYRFRRTIKGALVGLAAGTLCMTVIMLLWNALITPLYTGMPREAVVEMLLPVFLPFNLLKAVMNSALVMLLYKNVVTVLRKARLLPAPQQNAPGRSARNTVAISLAAVVLLATAVLVILAFQGVI